MTAQPGRPDRPSEPAPARATSPPGVSPSGPSQAAPAAANPGPRPSRPAEPTSSAPAVRLLHAGDWHLGRPIGDLPDLPEHLVETLIDAPYRAIERTVSAALAERVAAVILAGCLIEPERTGPRGVWFLCEQFARLDAAGIPVFWAGTEVDDPASFPPGLTLPANVHRFPADRVQELAVTDNSGATLVVLGRSGKHPAVPVEMFKPSRAGTPVAVVCGDVPADSLARGGVRYWALGGDREPRQATRNVTVACHVGPAQGLSFDEDGPRGCVIVELSSGQAAKLRPVDTDTVRYREESLSVACGATPVEIQAALDKRTAEVRKAGGDRLTLLRWRLTGRGVFGSTVRRDGWLPDAVAALRDRFSESVPGVFTTDITLPADRPYPRSWSGEDTMLGDFLRAVGTSRKAATALDLSGFAPDGGVPQELTAALTVSDPTARRAALQEACALGVDLLRGGAPIDRTDDAEFDPEPTPTTDAEPAMASSAGPSGASKSAADRTSAPTASTAVT